LIKQMRALLILLAACMLPTVWSQAGEAELPYIRSQCQANTEYILKSTSSQDTKVACSPGDCATAIAVMQQQSGFDSSPDVVVPAPAICDKHPQGRYYIMTGFTGPVGKYIWTCSDICIVIDGGTVTEHLTSPEGQPVASTLSTASANRAEGNKGSTSIGGVALITCAVLLVLQR
jgi:hypothetical protein